MRKKLKGFPDWKLFGKSNLNIMIIPLLVSIEGKQLDEYTGRYIYS